jgi:mannitol-1-/sugar-/sorbitol-6-phosphatase
MQIECRGVLFDLDGVLVDSTPAVERVWSRWAREHGFEPKSVVKQAHGRPSIATIRELLPNGDYQAEDHKVERWELEDLDGVVPLQGAVRCLRELPQERWAVVTSGTRSLATARIRTAGLPQPRHFITASDIHCGKPNPEPYLLGARSLGIPASDCLVIEDAPAGVQAGRAAGARVIAVLTTSSEAELRQAGAHWIIADLSKLRSQRKGELLSLRFDLIGLPT